MSTVCKRKSFQMQTRLWSFAESPENFVLCLHIALRQAYTNTSSLLYTQVYRCFLFTFPSNISFNKDPYIFACSTIFVGPWSHSMIFHGLSFSNTFFKRYSFHFLPWYSSSSSIQLHLKSCGSNQNKMVSLNLQNVPLLKFRKLLLIDIAFTDVDFWHVSQIHAVEDYQYIFDG